MTCPHCGTDTRPGAATCGACGAPLAPSDLNSSETIALTVSGSADVPTVASTAGHTSTIRPGQTVGSRYHVIRLLGVGGMGAVYHAWDAELGVAVALKVIRTDIAGDPDAGAEIERRFKNELLLARQVTHKHVVAKN